jgi:predicted transcriptional regulator of viral defense system
MKNAYQLLRQSGLSVFNRTAIMHILQIEYSTTNPTLYRLVERGVLKRLKRNCYVLADNIDEQREQIANQLVQPSYISLWTALLDAELTTHAARAIQSVTPKRSQVISHDGYTWDYAHLPQHLWLDTVIDDHSIVRASPEQALLDLLAIQKGSIDWQSIRLKEFDQDKLLLLSQHFPARVQRALRSSPLFV